MWVLLVACKTELLERRIDWVKRAGLTPALIDVDALALMNAFMLRNDDGAFAGGRCALMNVGAQVTNLVVFGGQVPHLVRDIPWGSEKLIRVIADQRGGDREVIAEELREEKLSPDLQDAVRVGTEGLVAEVQLSFDYFENRFGQSPDTVFVSGGLSESSIFLEGLRGHLSQIVKSWSPAPGLAGQFAVAYGLALRAA